MLPGYSDLKLNPYHIRMPAEQRVPFVLNSPHSGRVYVREFMEQSKLDRRAIRKSEDFLVDELFDGCVDLGLPLLAANFPRAYLDANREPYELDPAMFRGKLPDHASTSTTRVNAGLGTIPRIVSEREEIYSARLSIDEGLTRIDDLYKPYHQALRTLLARTHVRFGFAVLIDCHSMPSSSVSVLGPSRPDFILGDRYSTSCAGELVAAAHEFLTDLGYQVAINKPYAGGFITEHYGRPANGLHALQIEINRSLYMDEMRREPKASFGEFATDLKTFVSRLVSIPESSLYGTVPLAAE